MLETSASHSQSRSDPTVNVAAVVVDPLAGSLSDLSLGVVALVLLNVGDRHVNHRQLGLP